MKEYNEKEFTHLVLQIGIRIGYYRRKMGITQEELAEKTGMTVSCIGQLEAPNLVYKPSLKTLYKLSLVFDVPLIKLINTED